MSIVTKKPPIKETVGAQYICFNTMSAKGEWTSTFAPEVYKTETVKSVKVTDTTDEADVRASGKKYYTNTTVIESEIEVEQIAFPEEDLAKMRGDLVDEGGLVLSGGKRERPYFAYGKVVENIDGTVRYDWYPKCKLTENSDSTKTSEDKFKEQTDTIKIKAEPFDETGSVVARVFSGDNFPKGLTEDKFFAKPIMDKAGLAAATAEEQPQNNAE